MKLWILDSSTGLTLFYQSFMTLEKEINEHLVSGLLAAINQFIMTQFTEPIEAIDMGGLRWIYVHDKVDNLLVVAADTKEADAYVLKAQLEVLKLAFVTQFLSKNESWQHGEFDGNLTFFDPFRDVVEEYRAQWKKAEMANVYAEFYDLLRVFHQVLNLLKKTLDNQIPEKKRELLYDKIEDIFLIFKNKKVIKKDEELSKISFSLDEGFYLLSMDPTNCNMEAVKKHIFNLFKSILKKIKAEVGYELSLKHFAKEGVISYLFSNYSLLKKINIDKFLLEIFMLE